MEAPETAGTALKTILARFGEVKKLIDTGKSTGMTDEGEEIDVNKIDTALKTVGVRLTDTNGQMRALDKVIIELAEKWNSLDSMTQRYLATMSAGSRQQSRFLALMSNSERLTELLGEAYNSAGAGEKQYEKTLDSLESKLNNLHTAWTQFTTSILNSELIKGGIDLLTKLLNTVNALTDAFGPLSGTIKLTATGLGLWKVNTALLPKVTNSIKNIIREIRSANDGTDVGATAKKMAAETEKGTKLGTIFAKAYAAAKNSVENAYQKEQEAKDILNAQILGTEKAKAEMTSKKMYELAATTQGIEDAKLQATAEGLIYGEWKAKSQEEAMEAFESLSSVKRITTAFAYGKATGESWGAGFSSALAAFKTTDLFTKILSPFGPVIVAAMASAVVASIPAILSNADSIISNYKIKKNNQAKAENEELINQYEAEIASLENQESLSVGDKRRLQYLKEQTEELKKQNELLNQQNFGEEKKKRGKKEYTVYEQVEYTQAGGNERSSHAGETKTKTVSKQLEGEDAALDYASQKIDEYQEKLDNLGKGDSRYEGYKSTIEYYKNIAQDIFDFYSGSFEEITDTSDYEKLFKAADILGKDTSVLELFDSDTYDKIKELNEQGTLSAENLADLAKKSDILRIYLDTTGKTVEDFVKDLKSLETTNPFSTDKITGYKNAAEEIKNIKTSVSAITDAVSNLYKDGYVDIEKLSTIVNDDTFNKLPSFEKFFDILSKAGKEDIPQVATAMETLLQEYMSSETVLTSLNETTVGLYENMLTNMGVTNASEVIENKLQQRRAETAAQTLSLTEINNLLSGSNNNLSTTLVNLAEQYNTTTQYIAAYLIKMKIASGAKVSTAASRAELEKLIQSLGIASDALEVYYNIIALADSQWQKASMIRAGTMAGTRAEAMQYELNANANYESAKKVLNKKMDEILNVSTNVTVDTSSFNTARSKSSKTEKEIQKLSELYNAKKKLAAIDEKINDLEEKDNILQDYDSMLANERELIAAQKEKQDVLRELINQNEALRKQKLAEATSAWKNFYNVDETTHELQLTKTYYEAIKKGSKTAAKYSADTLNNFKKWAEEYEDIVEFSREQENSINSINSKLLETWYNYRTDYIDLVNQLAELYEQAQQKIIDDQKDAYDKLKEQDDNYLDELRKNIDARRKARDRENDVEEIVKKQKRLAMLMRDSSGRNAGEIADLQKEIQDAQQDVIDDDIDRVIDSMEEANDKQQENWDNVIDKLQEQLDQDKENGKFIRLAEQKFEEGPEAVMEQFRVFFQTTGPYSQAEIDKKLKEVLDKLDNAFEYYNGNNPAENPGGTGNRNYTSIKYLDPNGNVQQGYISSEGKTYKDRGLTERVDEGSIVPDAAGKHAWKLVGNKGVDVTSQLTDAQKKILGIGTGGQGTSSSNTNTNTTTSRAKVANTGGRGVNLRSGPGQNYRKVGAYSEGTTVTVLDESNSAWWKVKVGNTTGYMSSQYLKKYLNGGLVDFTGPAWVDGSKSAPEAFLDAQDTRNFAQLKDILASLLRADRFKANEVTTARGGDCTIYVTVDQIASDYDVDEAVARIKQEIMSGSAYRNINLVNRHR